MSITEIQRLPLSEKLQIMEAIWEDLSAHSEQIAMPNWHQELLDVRRKAVESGKEEVFDWNTVKDKLGSHHK